MINFLKTNEKIENLSKESWSVTKLFKYTATALNSGKWSEEEWREILIFHPTTFCITLNYFQLIWFIFIRELKLKLHKIR